MNIKKISIIIFTAVLFFGMIAFPSRENESLYISALAASELAAPADITASASSDSITLKWGSVSGADAYRVYMYDSYNKKFRKIKTVTETKASISGLKPNKSYRFMLSAVKKNGKKYVGGEYSPKFTVKTKQLDTSKNKTRVLTAYYVQTIEKGKDMLYTFDYDKNGRLIKITSNYCNSHAEEYEFRGYSFSPDELTVEYTENKAIITEQLNEENNLDSSVVEPLKTRVTTFTFNDNGNIDSVFEKYQDGNDIVEKTTTYKYDKNNNMISKSNTRKSNEKGSLKVTNSGSAKFDKNTVIDIIGRSSDTNYIYQAFDKKISTGVQNQNSFILNYLLTYKYFEIWDEAGVYRFVY